MMSGLKAAWFLALFCLFSFVSESESYIGIVDSDTYSTVNNFANECVKWRHLEAAPLKQFRLWKKLKKFAKKVKLCSFLKIIINKKSEMSSRTRMHYDPIMSIIVRFQAVDL